MWEKMTSIDIFPPAVYKKNLSATGLEKGSSSDQAFWS